MAKFPADMVEFGHEFTATLIQGGANGHSRARFAEEFEGGIDECVGMNLIGDFGDGSLASNSLKTEPSM